MSDQPFDVDPNPSSICSTGLRLNTLTGIFVNLLTRHFSRPESINDPRLKGYIWSGDERTSKILIVPAWRWGTVGQQKRPAITVRRTELRVTRLALADGRAVVGEPDPERIPAEQAETARVGFEGGCIVQALAVEPMQAELLADEAALRIVQFQHAMRSEFGFMDLRVTKIGELTKLEEASEYFAVPIDVFYAYHSAWQVWIEAPFLRRIVFQG